MNSIIHYAASVPVNVLPESCMKIIDNLLVTEWYKGDEQCPHGLQ